MRLEMLAVPGSFPGGGVRVCAEAAARVYSGRLGLRARLSRLVRDGRHAVGVTTSCLSVPVCLWVMCGGFLSLCPSLWMMCGGFLSLCPSLSMDDVWWLPVSLSMDDVWWLPLSVPLCLWMMCGGFLSLCPSLSMDDVWWLPLSVPLCLWVMCGGFLSLSLSVYG